MRVLTWTRHREPRDDRGIVTAEVLMWMAGSAIVITLLIGRMDDIMNRVVDAIDAALPG